MKAPEEDLSYSSSVSLNLGGLSLKVSPCMKPCKYVADTKAVTEARDCKGLSQGKQLAVREQSSGQSSRVPNQLYIYLSNAASMQ